MSKLSTNFFVYLFIINTLSVVSCQDSKGDPPRVVANNQTLPVLNDGAKQVPSHMLDAIRKFKSLSEITPARWGLCVSDTESGEILIDQNCQKSFTPASTLKLFATGVALDLLGKDFKFKTELSVVKSARDNSILNIIIRGGGDPSLGSDRFKENKNLQELIASWVLALKSLGNKQIHGSVVGDGSIYGSASTPPKWAWEDMGNYYGAGVSGLSIHENMYKLIFKTSAPGNKVKIDRTIPSPLNIEFINEIFSGKHGSGDNAYIFGSPYSNLRYLRGTIPPYRKNLRRFTIKGSIPDPALLTAKLLSSKLKAQGFAIHKPATTIRLSKESLIPKGYAETIIYTNNSPPLSEIIYWTNLKSVNMFAEHLLRAIGSIGKSNGNLSNAIAVLETWLRSKSIPTTGLNIADGSGLSRSNLFTPWQMVKFLNYFSKHKDFSIFYDSLPIAGQSGSLKKMMGGTCAENNIHAKSGYMSRVRSYAGYITRKDGQIWSFNLVVNNYTGSASGMKKELEKIMVALCSVN